MVDGGRFEFCRNTIQSSGWSYHDNNSIIYQDKNVNGCNFWQRPKTNYNFNENQFRFSNTKPQRQPYHDLDDHLRQASADYRIRITVNSDTVSHRVANSKPPHSNPIPSRNRSSSSNSSSASIEESESNESAASVTIVEIDDVPLQPDRHSNVDEAVTTHIKQHPQPPKQHQLPKQPYNEKAIDVPAEFERRAYEYQRNELSPFVRNLQPNSQVKNIR